MKEFIDKLIERLEEEKEGYSDTTYYALGIGSAIKIVNKLAEEYKVSEMPTGWIYCSERVPNREEYIKNDGRFIVTDGNRVYQGYYDVYNGMFVCSAFASELQEDKCVIAWQPLPALPKPYKKGE